MEPSLRGENRVIRLPYGFWTESFGAAAAYVYAVNGYPQPQASLLGTVMVGTTGSGMGLLMGQNIRPFGSERLFFDPILSVGYFSDADADLTATRTSRMNAPAATSRTRTTSLRAVAGTTTTACASSTCCPSAAGATRCCPHTS